MTDKERMSFSVTKIGPALYVLNEKIRELYRQGGNCFISICVDEKMVGPAPNIQVDLFDPGCDRPGLIRIV